VPATLRAQLDDAVNQIVAFQGEQGASTAAAKGETAKQKLVRGDIFARLLHPIDGVAKKKLKDVAEFPSLIVSAAFRLSNKLLSNASGVADSAAKYEKVFVDNGLPADFIAQLRTGIAEVTASEATRVRQLSRRAAATTGILAADKALRAAIDSLNRVLSPALKGNPSLLADWLASKRLRQSVVTPIPTGSPSAPAGSAAQPPSTGTATPATPASASSPAAPTTSTSASAPAPVVPAATKPAA
jgi:hypothetical protein